MPELFESDWSATLPLDKFRKTASRHQTGDLNDRYRVANKDKGRKLMTTIACAQKFLAFLPISVYRCSSVVPSTKHAAKLRSLSAVSGKDRPQVGGAEMLGSNLAEHVAEIRRQRQIPAFI